MRWGIGLLPNAGSTNIGQLRFCYSLECHGQPRERYKTYQNAYASQVPFSAIQILSTDDNTSTKMPSHGTMVAIDDERFAVTALKRRISDNGLVLRGFNLIDQSIDFEI